MPLSMYDASVPVFVRMLKNTDAILEKAIGWAETRKIKPDVLAASRLAPDMLPLSGQIQIATDQAKGGVARLGGVEIPSYPDTETTLEDLRARLAKTIAFVQSVTAAQIESSEDRTITLKLGGRDMSFSGRDYLLNFVTPNVYFHLTTTYAILRHNGLEIGKLDFLGRP